MYYNKIIQNDISEIESDFNSVDLGLFRDKKILVTGATGFIGGYICYSLLNINEKHSLNLTVYASVRNIKKANRKFADVLDRSDFEILKHNLNDELPEEMNISVIIHTASNTSPEAFTEDPVGTIYTNVNSTMVLLNSLKKTDNPLFIYLSTREIYGQNVSENDFVDEDTYGVLNPSLVRSCYPESKRIGETVCASYNSQYNIDYRIIRIAHTYGPGMTLGDGRVVGDFFNSSINGEPIKMNSDGSGTIVPTYISDIISGILYSIVHGNEFIYNVANNEIYTVKEIADAIAKGQDLFNIIVERVFISENERKGYLKYKPGYLDAERIRSVGWTPKVSLENGIKRTLLYYR